MTRIRIVSRHPGSRDWLRRQGIEADSVSHLAIETVREGDTIIGNLPAHIAAQVTLRGARYLHLALDLPEDQRGEDLDADAMERLGARLVPLAVLPDPRQTPAPAQGAATLVTLLGAPRGDYAVCTYDIGGRSVSSRWFPDALVQDGRNGGTPIGRLVVIGTPGSGWDLLARIAGLGGSELEFRLFAEAEEEDSSPDALNELAAHLSAHYGFEVQLLLVPYAGDANTAGLVAAQLGRVLRSGEEVTVDVTFGLRDVMLGVIATLVAFEALHHMRLRRVIYAPIRDPRRPVAEVMAIPALPEIIGWIRAISAMDATGDLRPVAHLLATREPYLSDLLTRQDADERLLRPRRAAERARHMLDVIERTDDPITALFRGPLRDRLAWACEGTHVSALQAGLARRALANGDMAAAAALALEASVSAFMEGQLGLCGAALEDGAVREQAQEQFNIWAKGAGRIGRDCGRLRRARNALLHASVPENRETARLLTNPGALRELIETVLAARVEPSASSGATPPRVA